MMTKVETGAHQRAPARQTRTGRLAGSDKEQADELMARLLKITEGGLYEDAWLNLAMFTYYEKWGTPQQQLAGVEPRCGA